MSDNPPKRRLVQAVILPPFELIRFGSPDADRLLRQDMRDHFAAVSLQNETRFLEGSDAPTDKPEK